MMEFARPEVMIFVFLAVGAVALFSFLSLNTFVDGRRKERDAFYKNETVRRLTESQGAGAEAAIALLQEEDKLRARKRVEGLKLSGLVTTAAGLGVMVFLAIANGDNRWLGIGIGGIPLLIGLAILLYAYRLAPKPQA